MAKQTNFEWLRDRLLAQTGLIEAKPIKRLLSDLYLTEWSPLFESLMRNRLVMGALRYGDLEHKKSRPANRKYDVLTPISAKIAKYQETGNLEYLVDAANYCLLEFELSQHPNKHFKALDDHHDHCEVRPVSYGKNKTKPATETINHSGPARPSS